ncbi:helix-turn-helix domain-containing protein [Rhodococcus sp. UNC23MFCrub1.1]|uniref:helix-turn-helix domain-containing protein n=1 Tax=Rhodococcus sp. UNC23MFCrub1.1 TaxID=1449068 RepID=UPI0012DE81C2|nr:helix-turn-helix domain-containing protein [Rhodococcus sp. UNC23MFCrub1.1]
MVRYTQAQRLALGEKLAEARAAVRQAFLGAEMMARSAHDDGIPEKQIATELGVDRMTVRKWVTTK